MMMNMLPQNTVHPTPGLYPGGPAPPPLQAPMLERPGSSRPTLPGGLVASCPLMCVASQQGLIPLPIASMQFEAECQISIAFVKVNMVVTYPHNYPPGGLLLFVPKAHGTTITNVLVENMMRDSMFATALVPVDSVDSKWKSTGDKLQEYGKQQMPLDAEDPELFTLNVPTAQPGEQFQVSFNYFHPLSFEQGRNVLRLPSVIPQPCLNGTLNQIAQFTAVINTGLVQDVRYSVTNHPIVVRQQRPGYLFLEADRQQIWQNVEFEVSYQVWSNSIVASCLSQPPATSPYDPRGTFLMSILPPAPQNVAGFPRSVIFAIDRSGSMAGEAMSSAKRALIAALTSMADMPGTQFTVVAFDHEQLWWMPQLVEANVGSIQACVQWVTEQVEARGLTDIMGPLQTAYHVLAQALGLPYIFLLTDGAVDNERQICHFIQNATNMGVQSQTLTPRVSTLGVGPYCNHFFLKQAAILGRGISDVAFKPQGICERMQVMLQAVSKPVLTNLTLTITDVDGCELYPYPLPDLFCGQPLLIAGKYGGQFPGSITLNGLLPGNAPFNQSVKVSSATGIPLDKVFVRNQLDIMTAQAWLAETPKMVQQVVDLSVATGVPCAHTRMVGFETTRDKYSQFQVDQAQGKKSNVALYAVGGGVVVLTGVCLALAFGDVAATLANAAAFADVFGSLGGVGDALGDMDVGCCECADCGDCDFPGVLMDCLDF